MPCLARLSSNLFKEPASQLITQRLQLYQREGPYSSFSSESVPVQLLNQIRGITSNKNYIQFLVSCTFLSISIVIRDRWSIEMLQNVKCPI